MSFPGTFLRTIAIEMCVCVCMCVKRRQDERSVWMGDGGGFLGGVCFFGEICFGDGDVSLIGETLARVTRPESRTSLCRNTHLQFCTRLPPPPPPPQPHSISPPVPTPLHPSRAEYRIAHHGRRHGSRPAVCLESRSIRRENRCRGERRREARQYQYHRCHRHSCQVETEREESAATREKETKENTVVTGE